MSAARDFDRETQDVEGHRYAYDFDLDVMHKYMMRAFEPFFRPGRLPARTRQLPWRLHPAPDAVLRRHHLCRGLGRGNRGVAGAARRGVRFVQATFEGVALPECYATIVLTHVLEHLDDPVGVLARINAEWLAEGGRQLLACPNAIAPSRQIAVKIGLISHNTAVTEAERQHGHRCTYSLDTLERDASVAGLRVIHRSGVFFKVLANFQWDALLKTDIVSPAYFDGCYALGQVYPDMCASIYLWPAAGWWTPS